MLIAHPYQELATNRRISNILTRTEIVIHKSCTFTISFCQRLYLWVWAREQVSSYSVWLRASSFAVWLRASSFAVWLRALSFAVWLRALSFAVWLRALISVCGAMLATQSQCGKSPCYYHQHQRHQRHQRHQQHPQRHSHLGNLTYGCRHSMTELTSFTDWVLTAFGVLAVDQTVWANSLK